MKKYQHFIFLFIAPILLLVTNQHTLSAQIPVYDALNQALNNLSNATRAAEFEENVANIVSIQESFKVALQEMGVNTENWKNITEAFTFIKDVPVYMKALNNAEEAVRAMTNTYEMNKMMMTSGFTDINQGLRTSAILSEQLRDLVVNTKYLTQVAITNNNKALTAAEKIEQLDKHNQEFKKKIAMANRWTRDMYETIQQQADSYYFQRSRNQSLSAEIQKKKPLALNDGQVLAIPDKKGKPYSSTLPSGWTPPGGAPKTLKIETKTIEDFQNEMKSQIKISSWTSSASTFARNEISPLKGMAIPFARIVIIFLAISYTALNMLRVMKGEGQSRDALLKVMLGLLFALITLSILQTFFVG